MRSTKDATITTAQVALQRFAVALGQRNEAEARAELEAPMKAMKAAMIIDSEGKVRTLAFST